MATTYMTKREFTNAKAALTRVINKGDPQAIIDHVNKTFADWDDKNMAWPDDWARWERAREDARWKLRKDAPWTW